MGDPVPHSDTVVVCVDTLPAVVRAAVAATCDRLKVALVEWAPPSGKVPPLAIDPLLVIAGLGSGARSVPPQIGNWTARCLPEVPLCFFTEETLVRPSLSLHHGALQLVGAPLTELRISALVSAWIRSRQRHSPDAPTTPVASMIGGRVRLLQKSAGPHVVGSFVHETDAASLPLPMVDTRVGVGAVVALAPRAIAHEDTQLWTTEGDPLPISDGVVASARIDTQSLDVLFSRDDIDVRLTSPDRTPGTSALHTGSATGRKLIHAESKDLLLVSWPRGAVSTELVGQIMLDGISPLLSAFEILFRTSPSAFAAAAIQVR